MQTIVNYLPTVITNFHARPVKIQIYKNYTDLLNRVYRFKFNPKQHYHLHCRGTKQFNPKFDNLLSDLIG